jgi:hypothetical protein
MFSLFSLKASCQGLVHSTQWFQRRDWSLKNKSKATFEIEQCGICAALWWPFWKWWSVEIFRYQESIRDIIIYPHMKCHWNRTMLNFCGIVVAIMKMTTGTNLSRNYMTEFHEAWWSYRYMFLVGPKVFSLVVKGVNVIFWGLQRGWGLL